MSLLIKRILATLIDFSLVLVYEALLFGVSYTIQLKYPFDGLLASPFKAQLLSFFTLTIPLFCYYFFSEKGIHKATLGKRMMKIKVQKAGDRQRNSSILTRNLLNFIPWEIAHTGVYQIVFFSIHQQEIPMWVGFLLGIPQLIMLIYIISILLSKGKGSVYDKLANTQIEINQQ